MRRDAMIALLVLVGLLAAGCGQAETPATSPPAEEVTAEGSDAADVVEEESIEEPEPDPSKPHVEITARDIAFDTDRLVAPAGEAFQIILYNEDSIEHNVAVYDTLNDVTVFAHPLFRGELHRGPGTIIYDVPPLEAGKFVFWCDAHLGERMTGTFRVK